MWISTHRMQSALRHSTGKVTVNDQENWCRQSEVRGRIVGPSSSSMVDTYGKIDVSFGERRLINIYSASIHQHLSSDGKE